MYFLTDSVELDLNYTRLSGTLEVVGNVWSLLDRRPVPLSFRGKDKKTKARNNCFYHQY
jgi:hypothetical protein